MTETTGDGSGGYFHTAKLGCPPNGSSMIETTKDVSGSYSDRLKAARCPHRNTAEKSVFPSEGITLACQYVESGIKLGAG